MNRWLVKPMICGLTLGLIIGSMGFIGYSYLTGYSVFGVQWRPIETYYMKLDLGYIYLRYYDVPSNIPLLGDKTLLEYVVIVRVENPYPGITVVPQSVRIGLYESLLITEDTGQNITVSITVSRNGTTMNMENGSTTINTGNNDEDALDYQVLFDSYEESRTVSCLKANDLLFGAGKVVVSSRLVDDWLYGGDKLGKRKYYVIRGVVELPDYGARMLRGSEVSFYFVVEFNGEILDRSDRASGQLIGVVKLVKTDSSTYVFNRINHGSGFVLEGETIETFWGEPWP